MAENVHAENPLGTPLRERTHGATSSSRGLCPATTKVGVGDLLGDSAAMHTVFDQIRRVAPTRASVVIIGESGVGKELVACTVHELSPRAAEPFLSVNCAAIAPRT